MAYPSPTASLSAASVTTTPATGSTLTDGSHNVYTQHSATFTITNWVAPSGTSLQCLLQGSLDGTNWFIIASANATGNSTQLLAARNVIGELFAMPFAYVRCIATFTGYGAGSPTCTVTATAGSAPAVGSGIVGLVSPSNDTTGVTDAAAVNAALTTFGTVILASGTYYGNATVNVGLGQAVIANYLCGTVWKSVVASAIPAFKTANAGTYSGALNTQVSGFTIDGTGAAAGAIGIQAGDVVRLKHDLILTGFSGAGSVGVYLLNGNYWTEQGDFKYYINNCTTGVKLDQSGAGTNSFDRCRFDVTFNQTVNQQGFVIAGATAGINLLECDVRLVGNWAGSSASTGIVLALAASNAKILTSKIKIGIEIDGGTVGPQTINFSGASNIIQDCWGMLEFYGSSWQASNNNFNMDFRGTILGDDTLLVKPKGSQNDVSVNSGWPAGVSGTVTFKLGWENSLVFVSFNISVAATALTAGETLLSGLAAKLRSSSSKKFPVDANGVYNYLQVDSSGNLKVGLAVGSGTYTIEGTGVYSNAL